MIAKRLLPALLLICLSVSPATAGSALIAATKQDNGVLVGRLLAEGTDPDCHDEQRNTALIFAARDGRLEIAQRLIAAGARVDWIDGEGVSPLILAAFKNHPEVARLLLAEGADSEIRDQWGRTALDYALRRGEADGIARQIKVAGGAN